MFTKKFFSLDTNTQKGFTLIELMVVISVISLVSSIITYSTSEAKVKAEDSKMIQESQQVEKAIQIYKNDNFGMVPGANVPSVDKGRMYGENESGYESAMNQLVTAGYYPKIPRSSSGNRYAYMVGPDGQSAVFSAVLKKTNTGSGGLSKNECDIVADNQGSEISSYTSCSRQDQGSLLTCEEINYDSNSQKCFYITSIGIDQSCTLNEGSGVCSSLNEANFPSSLCSTYSYECGDGLTFSSNGGFLGTYLCDIVQNNSSTTTSVCSGSGFSNNDYCTCI